MKLDYQYMVIFITFSPTSSHLHPLQVENCDSNSRLVVDEDDNGKFRPERVKFSRWDIIPTRGKSVIIKWNTNNWPNNDAWIHYAINRLYRTQSLLLRTILTRPLGVDNSIFLSLYIRYILLNPHDALKHHFTSLKTDLILLKLSFLKRKFQWNWLYI